jgi:hypothetical protein
MTRAELIVKVTQAVGRVCTPHLVRYLLDSGRLGDVPKRHGWLDYSAEHEAIIAEHLRSSPRYQRRQKGSAKR